MKKEINHNTLRFDFFSFLWLTRIKFIAMNNHASVLTVKMLEVFEIE